MGETTGVIGQINRTTVVETFVATVYGAPQIFNSQKLAVVSEAYPLPPFEGGLGGTLSVQAQIIAAHGMQTSGVGTIGAQATGLIGTIAASITATIAATLAPNAFLARVYTSPAGTLVEVPSGSLISGALTFLLKGY